MELIIKTAGGQEVVRSGVSVTVNMQKLGEGMVEALLAHGIAAKVGDAAASASALAGEQHFGKVKKDVAKGDWAAWQDSTLGKAEIMAIAESAMEGVLESLYAGNWSQGRNGGPRVARLADDWTIAVKAAKADLLILFKKVSGKAKLVDMAAHEKIAPFFQDAGEGVAWDDAVVVTWIQKQADGGARDYLAEAQATLDVDLSALEL